MKRIIRKLKQKAKNFKVYLTECRKYGIPFFRGRFFVKRGFCVRDIWLYNLNKKNFKDYITYKESFIPRNKNSFKEISDNKYVFSKIFSEYVECPQNYALIRRGKFYALQESISSFEEFSVWMKTKVHQCICKIYNGADGYHIYSLEFRNHDFFLNDETIEESELKNFLSKLDNYLIQSRLTQSAFANRLYPKTINTVRIVSAFDKEKKSHRIVAAVQRIGCQKSYPVDNFNQNGLVAEVDIVSGKYGRVATLGKKDAQGNQIYFDTHPDTGFKITGLQIPHWKEICEKIVLITEKIPFFDFVAWDVVLSDNSDFCALIETNMKTSIDIFQLFGPMRETELGKAVIKQ